MGGEGKPKRRWRAGCGWYRVCGQLAARTMQVAGPHATAVKQGRGV